MHFTMAKRAESFDPTARVILNGPHSAVALRSRVSDMRAQEGLPTREFLAQNGIPGIKNAPLSRNREGGELLDTPMEQANPNSIGDYTAGPELTSPVEKALDDAAGQKVTVVWLEPTDPAR